MPGLVSRLLQQLQDHGVIADGRELRQRRGHVRAAGLISSIFQDDLWPSMAMGVPNEWFISRK